MAHEPLKNRPLFSIQNLVDIVRITDLNRLAILLIGLLGDAEPAEAPEKLALIRVELLRSPTKGEALSEDKVDVIISHLENEIEEWRWWEHISG